MVPEEYEHRYVHDVYSNIAEQFNQTRYKVWPSVEQFINREIGKNGKIGKTKKSKVLEVGCGNGKNLVYIAKHFGSDNIEIFGCDLCDEFIDITRKHGIQCVKGDVLDLPFEDEEFDVVLSVAVIHHLCSVERRQKSIQEMFRLLKPGGSLFIQVWAYEQPETSKRQFEGSQDQLVSWNNQHVRYYYVFKEGELEQLVIDSLPQRSFAIEEQLYECGNWCIVIRKN